MGGKNINPLGDFIFSSTEDDSSEYFGISVAGGGDLNGDGFDDFVIASPGFDNIFNEGRIYVYFGGTNIDTTPDLIIEREFDYWNHPNFGYQMVLDGDVNGDGYDDLITSARRDYYLKGKVYIYLGGANMNPNLDIYIEGEDSDQIGGAISYVGDLNNDDYDDFVVTSFRDEGFDGITNSFYLFWGEDNASSIGFNNSKNIIVEGERGLIDISKLSDINLDGDLDFAIIQPNNLYLYSYDDSNNSIYNQVTNSNNNEYFGRLSNSADINGDGYKDFILGVSRWTETPQGSGRIYYGGESFNLEQYDTILATDSISNFGSAPIAISKNFTSDGEEVLAFGITSIMVNQSEFDRKGYVDVFSVDGTTAVDQVDNSSYLNELILASNYPNPFNQATNVKFDLPEKAKVTLKVFNILGKLVSILVDNVVEAGIHTEMFDGKDLPSGIYVYTISASSLESDKTYSKSFKMMLTK